MENDNDGDSSLVDYVDVHNNLHTYIHPVSFLVFLRSTVSGGWMEGGEVGITVSLSLSLSLTI